MGSCAGGCGYSSGCVSVEEVGWCQGASNDT